MDNNVESMLDMYLFETNSLLDQLEELLIDAEKLGDFSSDNVNSIFRIMHTIKGSSAMMEFSPLMTVAHRIEDMFFFIRENGIEQLSTNHKKELFDLMFQSNDYLCSQVSKIESNEPLTDDNEVFLGQINAYLQKISSGDDNTEDEVLEENTPSEEPETPEDEEDEEEKYRAYIFARAKEELEQEALASKSEESKTQDSTPVTTSTPSSPQNTNTPAKPAPQNTTTAPAKQSMISVNLSKLDSLMAVVGEIVITESMVALSPELKDVKLDSFLKSTRQLRNLTDELQDIAMSLRMVSVSNVFQKMRRIVRDMNQQLGKQVKLEISGEDTELDKTIVDAIGDPLMHIVRNAMDHGIEKTKEERLLLNKPESGTIKLSASHTGSEIIITIQDDGKGMDPDAILTKAARNGLLTKSSNEYTKKEILGLLLLPGFSTNEVVTEFSGRGVGMDVVKKNVESVGGNISINSDFGYGSTVTLKIPLTLAIVDGMETTVGKSIFTIPIAHIQQSLKVSADEVIFDTDGNEIIERRGAFYPIIRLHKVFNIETEITNIEDGILVWVESSEKSYCLFLDELIGEQQVVVKPLPPYLNQFHIKNYGITGCTILGDGNISIILDIVTLYDVAQNQY